VSQEHSCPLHGTINVQHFAAARNEAFTHLDPSLAFHSWIDADDELLGGEKLAAVLERCAPESAGLWGNYVYAHAKGPRGEIQPTTEFYRERFFRTTVNGQPVTWTWQHRVHEVCVPSIKDPKWTLQTDVVWLHQSGAHKSEDSAPRNDRCLEVELEEDPGNARTTFYLGNSKFAQRQWDEAAGWYQRLLALDDPNTYQNWQAATYLAKSLMQLGDVDGAIAAAYKALDVKPDHPEPYFDLAQCYALAGDDEKVAFWTHAARVLMQTDAAGNTASGQHALVKRPPFFVFVNPLDYSFNGRMPIADALARAGKIGEAAEEYEAAYRVVPDEKLRQRIADLRATEARMHAANAFVQMARTIQDEDAILRLYDSLPDDVKAFGRTRDVAMPILLKRREERYAA
jgi:tetratricopeptide (TPR) repeat protein